MTIRFFVAGAAIPQGSARQVPVGKGASRRWFITSDNRNLKGWRQRIASEAQVARLRTRFPLVDAPVAVRLAFRMPRPASLPKRVTRCAKKPDLDKLVRAVFDGVTNILIADDARVDALVASKRYAEPGETPGVEVRIDTGTPLATAREALLEFGEELI